MGIYLGGVDSNTLPGFICFVPGPVLDSRDTPVSTSVN